MSAGHIDEELRDGSLVANQRRTNFVSAQRRTRISIFLLTYISYTSVYGTRKPFSVVKSDVQLDLGLSAHALGVIDTCFLATYALGQLLLPSLVLRTASIHIVIPFAFCGSAIAAFCFANSHSPTVLSLIWSCNGAFHALTYPFLVQCLAVWFPSSMRGRVLSAWTTSQQVGSFLATAFAAWASSKMGWRSVFYIPGAFLATVGVLCFFLLPKYQNYQNDRTHEANGFENAFPNGGSTDRSFHTDDSQPMPTNTQRKPLRTTPCAIRLTGGLYSPRQHDHSPNASSHGDILIPLPHVTTNPQPAAFGKRQETSILRIIQLPDVKNIGTAYFFVKCIRYSILFWLPYYLQRDLDFPSDMAGYASLIFDLGGIPGALFLGFASDKIFKGRRILAVATQTVFTSLALFSLSLVNVELGFAVPVFLVGLIGFCVAGPDSLLSTAAVHDIAEANGLTSITTATGFVNGCGSLGAVLQGLFTTRISARYGWPAVFKTLAGCSLVSFACLVHPAWHEHLRCCGNSDSRTTGEFMTVIGGSHSLSRPPQTKPKSARA